MFPTDEEYGNWPRSGEIDIMEYVGYQKNVVHSSVHTKDYNFMLGNNMTRQKTILNAETEFHVYALNWTKESLQFFVDGALLTTYQNKKVGWEQYPFDKDFFFILYVAIGGSWGGVEGIDDTIFPTEMVVNYVRVFDNAPIKEPYPSEIPVIPGRVEAENFDKGCESFFDYTPQNEGGEYREEDGDIKKAKEGQGYVVSSIKEGEWLNYSINILRDGSYDIDLNVDAVDGKGSIVLFQDGKVLGETNSFLNSNNGVVSVKGLDFKKGAQEIKLLFKEGGFDLDWLDFKEVNSGILPEINQQSPEFTFDPAQKLLKINSEKNLKNHLHLYNIKGGNIEVSDNFLFESKFNFNSNTNTRDFSKLNQGIYIVKVGEVVSGKIFIGY